MSLGHLMAFFWSIATVIMLMNGWTIASMILTAAITAFALLLTFRNKEQKKNQRTCFFGGIIILVFLFVFSLDETLWNRIFAAVIFAGGLSIPFVLTDKCSRDALLGFFREHNIPIGFGGRQIEDFFVGCMVSVILFFLMILFGFILAFFFTLTLYVIAIKTLFASVNTKHSSTPEVSCVKTVENPTIQYSSEKTEETHWL